MLLDLFQVVNIEVDHVQKGQENPVSILQCINLLTPLEVVDRKLAWHPHVFGKVGYLGQPALKATAGSQIDAVVLKVRNHVYQERVLPVSPCFEPTEPSMQLLYRLRSCYRALLFPIQLIGSNAVPDHGLFIYFQFPNCLVAVAFRNFNIADLSCSRSQNLL